MHQPDYRDSSGVMQMPWVFLHAIKDYYDMPWILSRHENIKATFNITPPLIQQIELYYENPQESDRFLKLWLKESSHLSESEYKWVEKICKSSQYDTMVAPLSRYAKLYKKEHYSSDEFLDLQMLFMLSWCGVYLRQNSELVASLIEKGSYYSQDDKYLLLNELSLFIQKIFPYYSQLKRENKISISTTPLNHPILPLLMDMKNATRANPHTEIPKNHISLPDDAKEQVLRAKELFVKTFGFEAEGFWPAEGAVDEKSVALLKECGIKWIATDEAILFKSLQHSQREALYSSYSYKDIRIGFRDHGLSDLIGFTYRFWEAQKAAEHFSNSLATINTNNTNATVFVILDGENAWEFFKNNAFDFFDELYKKLSQSSWCKIVTMEEVAKLPAKTLNTLAPGSWIHGEFNTWVGHKEKTAAWELIYLCKRDYEHHKSSLDDTQKAKISEHFLASECSDWFWWYGDDHFSEFGEEFDTLFRSHLISIYDIMNITPPHILFKSIIKDTSPQDFHLQPQSFISPTIDGLHESFFEWLGCGVVDESKLFSTMDRVRGAVDKIYYGQDSQKIYFAFDVDIDELKKSEKLKIIIEPIGFSREFSLLTCKEGIVEIAVDKWLEIAVDKSGIDIDKLVFRFELGKEDIITQTLPGFGELEIDLDADYSEKWFV